MRAKKKKSDMEKLRDGGLRIWHIIAILVLFVLMVFSLIYSYNNRKGIGTELIYDQYDNNLILNGVFAENVNIGGLTKKQAEDKINREYVLPRTSEKVAFTYKDYKKEYTKGELGLGYNVGEVVNEAYKTGRSGGKLETIINATEIADRREFITIVPDIDEGKIKSAASQVSGDIAKMGAKADKEGIITMIEDSLKTNDGDSDLAVPIVE